MFQFPAFASCSAGYRYRYRWVAPFGYPRVTVYLPLDAAFRSLSRPSSPPRAKASPMRPSLTSLFLNVVARSLLRCFALPLLLYQGHLLPLPLPVASVCCLCCFAFARLLLVIYVALSSSPLQLLVSASGKTPASSLVNVLFLVTESGFIRLRSVLS